MGYTDSDPGDAARRRAQGGPYFNGGDRSYFDPTPTPADPDGVFLTAPDGTVVTNDDISRAAREALAARAAGRPWPEPEPFGWMRGLARAFAVVLWIVTVLWDLWFVVVGFAGGYLPVPWLWYTGGGFLSGVLAIVGAVILSGIFTQIMGWVITAVVTGLGWLFDPSFRRALRQ